MKEIILAQKFRQRGQTLSVRVYGAEKEKKMNYLRMFADEQGESHFENADLSSNELPFIPKAPSVHVSIGQPVDNLVFMHVPTGWSDDGHTAPRKQWVMVLRGEIEFETSDGEIRRLVPGMVILAEDTTGRGHKARSIGDEDALLGVVQIATSSA